MKAKIFTILLFETFLLGTACSQNFNKAKLDSFFNILAEKNKAMGSITISKKGIVLYTNVAGYGLISDDNKKTSTILTKYRVGSITKMFTATMIFQLIEEGKIELTTPLDTFFPEIPNAKQITIGNLLNHRSGIHNFTSDPEYLTYMVQPKTKDEIVAIISKSKADFQPNEKAAYSNSNYVLLGYIVEKLSGKPYAKVLNERITSGLSLSNTYIGGKTNVDNNESYSYQFVNDWKKSPETDMSIPGGAGAIVSTPTDLVRFIEALFSLKLVSEKSLSQMKTMEEGYGMGMFPMTFDNKISYGHNGGIDGFASSLSYFPEDSLAIAFCSNGLTYPMNNILIGVLSIYFNKDYAIPTFKTISLKTEELDKYLGIYSCKALPIKITITKDNTVLIGQGTGQGSFQFEAVEKDKFKFDRAGIEIEFHPENNEFTMKQGGVSYLYTKE